MPVRRAEISKTARNHIFKGLRVFSKAVPDVSHVLWPQLAHSNVVPDRIVVAGRSALSRGSQVTR